MFRNVFGNDRVTVVGPYRGQLFVPLELEKSAGLITKPSFRVFGKLLTAF
jgi:hypothetical protein